MWHYILFHRCRIKQIVMYTHSIFDIVYFLHCCWYTFSHWQMVRSLFSIVGSHTLPGSYWYKTWLTRVSQQLFKKYGNSYNSAFMYYSVRRCTSPSRKTSYQPWLHLIYCCSSYPIWGFILRLAGHGLFVVAEIVGFVVAEIVGFVVAEIVGYLLLCKIGRCFGGWINGFLRIPLIHMAEFCK